MDKWTELRTAYKLARLGTLSATAEEIGVHRSTVMRHIDLLESSLGVVLFQRNDKGYIPTEAGLDIMRLGEVTDSHFSQLPSRLKNKEQALEGVLSITTVNELTSLVMPSIKEYLTEYPRMRLNMIGDLRNFDLEYGEADIAIRAGEKPTTPDNVVLPLVTAELVFCAHERYVQEYGLPDPSNITEHLFLALNERPVHLPWNEWIYNNIPERKIVLSASSQQILRYSLLSGCGIGIMPKALVADSEELVEISFSEVWSFSAWILVHRDMFQMPKIRKFLDILQRQSSWSLEW